MNSPSAVSPLLRRPLARLLFAILCLVPLTKLSAYTKQYLLIDQIPGEVTDDKYANQIEVTSFSWGAATTAATATRSAGATIGKVSVSDLNLSKFFDSSSPPLLMKLALGQRIPKATLTVVKFSGDTSTKVLEIVMTNVLITSLQTSGSEGGDKVSESMSLNAQSFQLSYTAPDGKVLVTTVTP